ncbi:MAG: DUF86 domain-containing protein [Patescibacteria group bacterium]
MIRKDLIKRKISLIQDDLANLTVFSKYTFNEIAADFIKQAALERMLERIINRTIDINQHLIAELATKETPAPKDYTETFLVLYKLNVYPEKFAEEISKSIGTRNKLVHEYDKVDSILIYESVGDCLRDYNQYCGYILKFLEKV